MVQAKLHGAAVQSLGGDVGFWQLIDSELSCVGGGSQTVVMPNGEMVTMNSIESPTCHWANTYRYYWYDDVDPDAWYAVNGPGGGGPGVRGRLHRRRKVLLT